MQIAVYRRRGDVDDGSVEQVHALGGEDHEQDQPPLGVRGGAAVWEGLAWAAERVGVALRRVGCAGRHFWIAPGSWSTSSGTRFQNNDRKRCSVKFEQCSRTEVV